MKVTIYYFASMKEAMGTSTQTLELPAGVYTVASLKSYLMSNLDGFPAACEQVGRLRVAVDHNMVGEEAQIVDGAEVAFFPPVTGG